MLNKEIYLDKRVHRTQNNLKNSLLILLQRKRFSEITITDITNEAGISRVTFYNHYNNIQKLLDYVIQDIIDDLINAYRKPYEHFKQFKIGQIKPKTVKLFEHVYQNADFYSAIINSDIRFIFQDKLVDELTKILLKDISLRNPKINIEVYANYQSYAISGLMINWASGGFEYSPMYMSEQLMEIVKISPEQAMENLN